MGTTAVRRAPRRPAPELPTGDVVVPAPPAIPEPTGSRWQYALQALPMLLGTLATAWLFAGRSGDRTSLIIGGLFGLSMVGMLFTGWGGGGQPRRAELMALRRDYLRQLAVLRRQVRATVTAQRTALSYRHPPPDQLWCVAESYRLWERRPADADFAVVRIGSGPQTLATPLRAPVTAELDELEPVTAGALRRFLDTYSVVPDLPVAVSLRGFGRVFVRGPQARPLVRAVLAQLATFHAPADLLVAVCPAPDRRDAWDELKWLPHAFHPTDVDGAGPARLVATAVADLEKRLAGVLGSRPRHGGTAPVSGPHVVVVLDGADQAGAHLLTGERALAGVTVIDIDTPPPRLLDRASIVLTAEAGRLGTATLGDSGDVGRPDALSRIETAALMRRLAPRRLATAAGSGAAGRREPALAELLGIADPPRSTARARRPAGPRPPAGAHRDGPRRAPGRAGPQGVGARRDGPARAGHRCDRFRQVRVAAHAGAGPGRHAFAGEPELRPDRLQGRRDRSSRSTGLPHVAAVITNLADELTLVDRCPTRSTARCCAGQELLRPGRHFASIHDYERARASGHRWRRCRRC
jgi:S-DNA-T family DNA segregation ATPase FtsK/SpoIIIE